MPQTIHELCRSIVDALCYDLAARTGLGDEYAKCEEEVLIKLRERWQEEVERRIRIWLEHQKRR